MKVGDVGAGADGRGGEGEQWCTRLRAVLASSFHTEHLSTPPPPRREPGFWTEYSSGCALPALTQRQRAAQRRKSAVDHIELHSNFIRVTRTKSQKV